MTRVRDEPVRIVVAFHSPFYAPVFLADRLGVFRAEGLDTTIAVAPPGGALDLVRAGGAEIALSGIMRTFVIADREGCHPFIAIAEVNSRDGFFLLSRTPEPSFAYRQLEGRRLALFGLAPTPWMSLQTAMREHGADPAKVHLLEGLDVGQGIEAVRRGDADYLQAGQPVAEELLAEGWHLACAQATGVRHVPYSSLIVSDATRRRRPALCGAVVRALARTFRWIATHDGAAAADVMAPDFPGARPDILRAAVTRLRDVGAWSHGPQHDRAAFERLGRMLVTGGLVREAAPYEALVDDTFAAAAVTALGG